MTGATGAYSEYDLSLTDGSVTVAFMFQKGIGAFRRLPRGVGVERKNARQETFTSGRGYDEFAKDTAGFYDSGWAWTMVDGQWVNAPLYKPGKGFVSEDRLWPGDSASGSFPGMSTVSGQPYLFFATSFVASANYTVETLYVLAQRRGTPSAGLYIGLHANNAGVPNNSAMASATVTWSDSHLLWVPATIGQAVVSGTTYWVVVGFASGTDTNYYNIYGGTATAKFSATVGSWGGSSSSAYGPLFRARAAYSTQPKNWKFFEYKLGLYAVTQPPSGAPVVYINGDRGTATGGSTTTVADTTKSWTTNQWAGCSVVFSGGALKGQEAKISSNTGTVLTVTPALSAAPGATDEYVILGSERWSVIAAGASPGHGLTAPVTDVAVMNDIIYFAQGSGTNVRRMQFTTVAGAWTPASADDGTNKADYLTTFTEGNKVYMYRGLNTTVTFSRAEKAAWGSDLVYGTAQPAGDPSTIITNLSVYDDAVYIGKADAIYKVVNEIAYLVPVAINDGRSAGNNMALVGWNTNLYFSFLDGFERLFGRTVDDIGPNKRAGMIWYKQGTVSDFRPVLQYGWTALKGLPKERSTNQVARQSTLLATTTPGGDWHEIFTYPIQLTTATGSSGTEFVPYEQYPIMAIAYQAVPYNTNRMWIAQGSEIWMLYMPGSYNNPVQDTDLIYAPYSYLTTGWIDYSAPELDKYFDELRLYFKYVSDSQTPCSMGIDYQLDNALDRDSWTYLTNVSASGYVQQSVGVTGRRIRFRFRQLTQALYNPGLLTSWELRSNIMNEVLYDFTASVRVEDKVEAYVGYETDGSNTAQAALAILQSWQEDATPLTMGYRTLTGYINGVSVHLNPVPLVVVATEENDIRLVGQLTLKQAT